MTEPTPYASNSNKAKEAKVSPTRPKVERVTTADIKIKPKSIGTKLKGVFFAGNFDSALQYVVAEVLLPAVRNTIVDSGKGLLDRIFYGDRPSRRPVSYGSRVQYSSPFSRVQYAQIGAPPDQSPRPVHQGPASNEILIASQEEARMVLERLTDLVDQYEQASLADLYDLVNVEAAHTDNKWGWTTLTKATIKQTREGWQLVLPPLEVLS